MLSYQRVVDVEILLAESGDRVFLCPLEAGFGRRGKGARRLRQRSNIAARHDAAAGVIRNLAAAAGVVCHDGRAAGDSLDIDGGEW